MKTANIFLPNYLVEDDEIGQFTFREIQFAQRRGIAVLVVSNRM
jgi:hypothetical protein